MCNKTGQPKTENTSVIQLDEDGQRRFAELLASPPAPTEEMKALGALPKLEIRRSDALENIGQQDFDDLLSLVTGMFTSQPEGWAPREWLTDWMARPVPALGWCTPTEVLMLPGGKEKVEQVLLSMGSGAFL